MPEAGQMWTVLIVASEVGSGDEPPGRDTKGLSAVTVAFWYDLNASISTSLNILFSVCSIKSSVIVEDNTSVLVSV